MKPDRDTMALVGALNMARAHFYMMRVGQSPYIDYEAEAADEAIRAYLEFVYDSFEEGAFENMEKLAWESVLQAPELLC